jgi:hypothetical protein
MNTNQKSKIESIAMDVAGRSKVNSEITVTK